jgi:hypothetical protein
MRTQALLLGVCLLVSHSPLFAAEEVVAFGLKHTIITNAEFSLDASGPLTVANTAVCSDCTNEIDQTFGAAIHLGLAEGGVFVTANSERATGWSMEGVSYGTINGVTNSRIGSVVGTRSEWATFPIHMDFSPIGATSYIYQIYFNQFLILQTNAGPDACTVYTGNYDSRPRVNPLWRDAGQVGVIVDFPGAVSQFKISGLTTYATRLVILAENPTNTVEHVSRIDVFGHNGLPAFTIENERLGMFGLYHQSLGSVQFDAMPAQLRLSNILSADFDGMVTELPYVQSFRASLVPYALTNDHFIWSFSASGTSSESYYSTYIGEVRFSHLAGVTLVTANFTESQPVLRAYSNGVFVGTTTTSNGTLGTISTTNLVLNSYRGAATQTNEPAYIGFQLATVVTLTTAGGTTLTGDEFRVSPSPAGTDETIGALTSFALVGENLGEVTIAGMETYSPPSAPLRLEIANNDSNVRLSWPRTLDSYYLLSKTNLNAAGWSYNLPFNYTNFQWYLDVPRTNTSQFYKLQNIYSVFWISEEN